MSLTPNEQLVTQAERYLGVAETSNDNRGKQIEVFQKEVGIPPGSAYCMAFMQYCTNQTSRALGIKKIMPTSAQSLNVWARTPESQKYYSAAPGLIAIWGHKTEAGGHTGIVTKVNQDGTFQTIEGNTSNGAKEGVFRKNRILGQDGDLVLKGFINPFDTKVNASKTPRSFGSNESISRISFARNVLQQVNAPVTQKNTAFLLAWMDQENSKASFNPLATTQKAIGAGSFNKVGIKNYTSAEQGIRATAETLKSKYYPTILASLRSGRPENSINASKEWKTYTGNNNYSKQLFERMHQYEQNRNLSKTIGSYSVNILAKNTNSTNTVLENGSSKTNDNAIDSFFNQTGQLLAVASSINVEQFGIQGAAWLQKTMRLKHAN